MSGRRRRSRLASHLICKGWVNLELLHDFGNSFVGENRGISDNRLNHVLLSEEWLAPEAMQIEKHVHLQFNTRMINCSMGIETPRHARQRLRTPKIDCNLLQPLKLQSVAVGKNYLPSVNC